MADKAQGDGDNVGCGNGETVMCDLTVDNFLNAIYLDGVEIRASPSSCYRLPCYWTRQMMSTPSLNSPRLRSPSLLLRYTL